jgi:5'-methylthioadenosine phosphorylase
MSAWTLGVIGGSGLYEIDGLKNRRWRDIQGPWGAPSDQVLTGDLHGVELVFLPRHGRGHRIPPGGLNARANIDALERAGCTDILAVSAVGSLREHLAPGVFVVADQYIDRTMGRASSFFGEGCVAHVSMAHPTCPRLSALAAEAARGAGAQVQAGGTYLVMEGPQFSTRAESLLYRAWGCDVIGMTGMPEAKLAREAELPYASVCMVTDFDAWREDEAAVEVDHILQVLQANAQTATTMVARLAAALAAQPRTPSPIDTCLDAAIITSPQHRDPALLQKLDAVAGRALHT